MHLQDRKLKFTMITHHANVTQCLGAVGGDEWFLGVAKPSIVDGSEINGAVKAAAGHYYLPPRPEDVLVFRVAGAKFLKLNVGTWHAGPLFRTKAMDFYNLELSNTNVGNFESLLFLSMLMSLSVYLYSESFWDKNMYLNHNLFGYIRVDIDMLLVRN